MSNCFDYHCSFNLQDCISKLGLEEKGRVQNAVTEEVLRLSGEYIPLDEGTLKDSGHIENGTDVVWKTPYAHYMWGGIVYEDPELHCAGFRVKDGGWRSRKGVEKLPTDRKLTYGGEPLRGAKWVPRMLQDGGLEQIQKVAGRETGK